jgi:hypothetical protein
MAVDDTKVEDARETITECGGADVGKFVSEAADGGAVKVKGRVAPWRAAAARADVGAEASPGALTAEVLISVWGMPPRRAKGRAGIVMESHEPFSEFLFRIARLTASCGQRQQGRGEGRRGHRPLGACGVTEMAARGAKGLEGVGNGVKVGIQGDRDKDIWSAWPQHTSTRWACASFTYVGVGGGMQEKRAARACVARVCVCMVSAYLHALSLRLVNIRWGGWRDARDSPQLVRVQVVAQRRSPRPVSFRAPAALGQGCNVLLDCGAQGFSLERFNGHTRLAAGLATVLSGSASTGLGATSR